MKELHSPTKYPILLNDLLVVTTASFHFYVVVFRHWQHMIKVQVKSECIYIIYVYIRILYIISISHSTCKVCSALYR